MPGRGPRLLFAAAVVSARTLHRRKIPASIIVIKAGRCFLCVSVTSILITLLPLRMSAFPVTRIAGLAGIPVRCSSTSWHGLNVSADVSAGRASHLSFRRKKNSGPETQPLIRRCQGPEQNYHHHTPVMRDAKGFQLLLPDFANMQIPLILPE
jgi:hypothetical protein